MAKWRKKGIYLYPTFKFKCLGCRDPLATFKEMAYALLNFPIYDGKQAEYNSYALDRQYMCTLCGWQMNFGIALTKRHWEEVLKHEEEKGRGMTGQEYKTQQRMKCRGKKT